MTLLALVQEMGLNPVKISSTNGGEYHSPCPHCSGKDRFMVWPQTDRYWCRQCNAKGDAIQFCRDFMGMDYFAACAKVGAEARISHERSFRATKKPQFCPKEEKVPSDVWQGKAEDFVQQCHQQLLATPQAVGLVYRRGISLETAKRFRLGWNCDDQFLPLPGWGLPSSIKKNGKEARLWLPKGLVVPTLVEGTPAKLKIRRSDWKDQDPLPKYVEVSGSMKGPSLYGDLMKNVIVLVEAEFDAILVQQFAADICCCIAIGGAGKKPDLNADQLLRRAPLVLFALDFDEAGKKAYDFWQRTYPQLKAWPVPLGKSPEEAFIKHNIDLKEWIILGH